MKKRGWILGLAALTLLSGCGAFPAESGVTEAVLGETVSTRWFDCTVEEAEARKSYESDTASGGNKLVVVELELKNTFHEAVSMYDTDFQLYWGGCGPDEWAMPLDPYCEDQLPREYDLEPGKSREGLLVYEVPQEETDITDQLKAAGSYTRELSFGGTQVTVTVEGSATEWMLTTAFETLDGGLQTFTIDSKGSSMTAPSDTAEGDTETSAPKSEGVLQP